MKRTKENEAIAARFIVELARAANWSTSEGVSPLIVAIGMGVRERFDELDDYVSSIEPDVYGIKTDDIVTLTQYGLDLAAEFEKESEKVTTPESTTTVDPKRVFVIVGRNAAANGSMMSLLRALGLKPTEFAELAARTDGSPYIGAIIRKGLEEAKAVIALFTPDEMTQLRGDLPLRSPSDKPYDLGRVQARPNVIFEAGMALGMDESKTILVTLGADVALFSDTDGRHCVRLDNTAHSRQALRLRLEHRGCHVEAGTDWLSAGDFEGCIAGGSGAPVAPAPAPTTPATPAHGAPVPDMPDDRRAMLLKRWLKLQNPNKVYGIPLDCEQIERDAGVPSDSADRLSDQWVDERWHVVEKRGGFITLKQEVAKVGIVRTASRRNW